MRNRIILPTFLVLLMAPCCFAADGGTLHSVEGEVAIREPNRSSTGSGFRTGQAMVDLGGSEPVIVAVVNLEDSFEVMVTNDEPYRLYYDSNGDGKPQPEEVHEESESSGPEMTVFDGVRIFMDVPGGRVPVAVSVFLHRHNGELWYASSTFRTHFAGTMTLDGKEYKSVLFFRTFNHDVIGNERIIVDTDGDEIFDTLNDFWFPVEGAFSFGGKALVSETIFTGDSAEVFVEPYTGPTGRLEIQSTGFHRATLWLNPANDTDLPAEMICLVPNEEQAWNLPTGSYSPQEVWLSSSSDRDLYWVCYRVRGNRGQYQPQIAEGETVTLDLGGPLTHRISVSTFFPALTGRVHVEYNGCTNQEGLEFSSFRRTPTGERDYGWAPSCEILDRNGQVITSADFEHG